MLRKLCFAIFALQHVLCFGVVAMSKNRDRRSRLWGALWKTFYRGWTKSGKIMKSHRENLIFTLPGEVREKSGKSQANYRIRAAPRQFLMLDSVPNGRQQIPKGRARSARPFGACCPPFGMESSIKNCRGTAQMR